MKISEILDDIKSVNEIESNAELAKLLDIDVRRIGEYYKGREPMSDDYPKIAIASGRRVDELQTIYKLSTSKDEKTIAIWSRYSKSIGQIAASVLLVILLAVTSIVTPTPAKAAPMLESDHQTLCIMLSLVE